MSSNILPPDRPSRLRGVQPGPSRASRADEGSPTRWRGRSLRGGAWGLLVCLCLAGCGSKPAVRSFSRGRDNDPEEPVAAAPVVAQTPAGGKQGGAGEKAKAGEGRSRSKERATQAKPADASDGAAEGTASMPAGETEGAGKAEEAGELGPKPAVATKVPSPQVGTPGTPATEPAPAEEGDAGEQASGRVAGGGVDQGDAPRLVENPIEERRPRPRELAKGQSFLELTAERAQVFKPCFLKKYTPAAGWPTVWVLSNSEKDSEPGRPAAYLRFITPPGFEESLEGHRVKAQLYLQAAPNAPVLASEEGAEIELELFVDDGEVLEGEIVSGQLLGSDQSRRIPVTGSFSASSRLTTTQPLNENE